MRAEEEKNVEELCEIRLLKQIMRNNRPISSYGSEGWDDFLKLLTRWESELEEKRDVEPEKIQLF